MRRRTTLAAVVATAALALSGCGGSSGGTSGTTASSGAASGSATAQAGPQLKIGLAYDIGGRGDQSFNDSAAAGLDKAKTELGVQAQEAEAQQGESEATKEERLRSLAEADYNPIIAVGFAYSASLAKVAKDFPDTRFAIIDDADAKGPNIANLTFAENEGSFLVGAAAALKSKTGKVGFVGGVQVPLIKKFEAGYKAGTAAGKSGTTVTSRYLSQPPDFSGFRDPAKGKTAAQGLYDAGDDVVFQAAGASGSGVFSAAKAAGKYAIGVDSDQAKTAAPDVRDVILTSMVKRVDVAVYDFVKSVQGGSFKAGQTVYDLKKGGVDYATTGGRIDDIKPQLEQFKQKIVSGQITVPTS